MDDTEHDVVIVGAGPVGLALARMLGLRGHQVLALERWPHPYPLPRAAHFDGEIFRIFADMGLAGEVQAISLSVPDHYEWRNAAGETLVRMDWSGVGPAGWPTANFFSQPHLEDVLVQGIAQLPNVTLLRDAEVVGIEDRDDDVRVRFTRAKAGSREISARFVVGCDGANSFVREHMGVPIHDQGFFFDWLIVDTIPHDDIPWSPMNWQLCDPARPTTLVSGGPGRRRWEFMLLPGEAREALSTTDKAWELLAPWGRTTDNTELERHAVYTFAARWAERWNRGRLAIAGDAAHQMPPFAGQGMCSGLRDAANLSWKLDRVLRGQSSAALLNTYTSERSVHVQHAIAMSVELGRVICVLDQEEAVRRDARMIAGNADPARVLPVAALPVLGAGVVAQNAGGNGDVPALRGTLAPQYRVTRAGQSGLSDEFTGQDPVLLVHADAPGSEVLDPATREALTACQVRAFSVAAAGTPDLTDVDGSWSAWFAAHDVAAVLIRPDHYVFGATSAGEGISGLIAEYRARLQAAASPAVPF